MRHPLPSVRTLCLAALLSSALPALAAAQPMPPHHGMSRHDDASQQMMEAMRRMDREMRAAPMSGDTDRDFARMMIPHHQGAIDMARIELRDGRDPELRRMARTIIAAQEKEIAELERWLARRRRHR